MHVISSLMGFALPSLMPRAYTHFASAVSVLSYLRRFPAFDLIFCNFCVDLVQILFLYFGYKLLRDAYDMDGVGPSEELQEVEEELRKSKGDGKEQEEDGDECDIVGNMAGGEGDVEKGNASSGKLSKQSIAAENLKVFTQVCSHSTFHPPQHHSITTPSPPFVPSHSLSPSCSRVLACE